MNKTTKTKILLFVLYVVFCFPTLFTAINKIATVILTTPVTVGTILKCTIPVFIIVTIFMIFMYIKVDKAEKRK